MRFPWDKQVDEADLSPHWFGRMLTALYFSTFMIRASFAIMLIAFPIYIIGLKSYFLFGIVVSSSPIFELLTVMLLGAYIDKHGRKNVLLLGLLTGSLALFGLLLTKDPILLFVVNAFHGMSAAAILVSSLALIADYAPRESRGKIMGVFDFTNLFGWIVGFGIGGLLIDTFKDNIGMTFVIAGLMGIVAWGWATLNVTEPRRAGRLGESISFRAVASVLKQRSVILLIAPWFIIYLLVSTMLTFTSKAGTQELGLSGRDLAIILGGGGTIFLVTQFVYGWASDKYGRTKIMIVGTVGIVGIMLTVGGVFLTAPATIAPAGHTLESAFLDTGVEADFILQSDYGVYLIGYDGTILRELGPPEGGFGHIQVVRGTEDNAGLISATKEAIQTIDLTSGAVTWVTEAHGPRVVRSATGVGGAAIQIFYVDERGVHVTSPTPSGALAQPLSAIPGNAVADALWQGGDLFILVDNGTGSDLYSIGLTHFDQATFGTHYHALRAGDASAPGSVLALSNGTADLVSVSGGQIAQFVVPQGAQVATLNGAAFGVIAYAPAGGTALTYTRDSGGIYRGLLALPGNLSAARFDPMSLTSTAFAAYASNGTMLVAQVEPLQSGWLYTPLKSFSVLVKRETAQATFGKLTSPQLVVPLVIFGLMAGAFGPAALAGLTDVSQADKRGTTMGLYSVVISSSMIVGPIVTGFLVDNYGGFGVMIFLVSSAAAMALFMAIRTFDVRRQGGEEHMLEKQREEAAVAGDPVRSADPAAAPATDPAEE